MNIVAALHATNFDKIFADNKHAVVVLSRIFKANEIDFIRIGFDTEAEVEGLWLDDLMADDWKVRVEAKP